MAIQKKRNGVVENKRIPDDGLMKSQMKSELNRLLEILM